MVDHFDRAQELDLQLREAAIVDTVAGFRIAAAMPGLHECCDCGDKIEPARLKAMPSARRCVACQAAAEERGAF